MAKCNLPSPPYSAQHPPLARRQVRSLTTSPALAAQYTKGELLLAQTFGCLAQPGSQANQAAVAATAGAAGATANKHGSSAGKGRVGSAARRSSGTDAGGTLRSKSAMNGECLVDSMHAGLASSKQTRVLFVVDDTL